jgi:hypothetical protein
MEPLHVAHVMVLGMRLGVILGTLALYLGLAHFRR